MVVVFISCKTTTLAQTKNKPPLAVTAKKAMVYPETPQMSPNTVQIAVSIIGMKHNIAICEKTYNTAVHVVLDEVVNTGGAIVNRLAAGAKPLLSFNKPLVNDLKKIEELFVPDAKYILTVVEKPCRDFSSTRYEIVHFEPLK